jgi:hypothetical protein
MGDAEILGRCILQTITPLLTTFKCLELCANSTIVRTLKMAQIFDTELKVAVHMFTIVGSYEKYFCKSTRMGRTYSTAGDGQKVARKHV